MAKTLPHNTVYSLYPCGSRSNLQQRCEVLSDALKDAAQKGFHLSELRQKNLNYALLIFAGLFTFCLKFPTMPYTDIVSYALVALMALFCALDRRLHRFVHGWRETKKMLMMRITHVVSYPHYPICFRRYVREGEAKAEKFGLRPFVFYMLVLGSILHVLFRLGGARS